MNTLPRVGLRALFCLCICSLMLSAKLNAQWLQEQRSVMGTQVSVELWSEDVVVGARIDVPSKNSGERPFVKPFLMLYFTKLSHK